MKCNKCGSVKIKSKCVSSFSRKKLIDQFCKVCFNRDVVSR